MAYIRISEKESDGNHCGFSFSSENSLVSLTLELNCTPHVWMHISVAPQHLRNTCAEFHLKYGKLKATAK